MQGGQGRGGSRQGGYTGRGAAAGRGGGGGGGGGGGMPAAAIGYGGMPGIFYSGWGGYNNYHMPGLFPAPPAMRPPHARGSSTRPFTPLGVQGAGILKRPAGPAQGGPLIQGRGHNRGHGGRGWGGRNRKTLTKEALDADLDEWRMKDKKFGGQSLDADLDEYWKKKYDDGEAEKQEAEAEADPDGKDEELETEKGTSTSPGVETPKKTRVAVVRPIVSHDSGDVEKLEQTDLSPPDNSHNMST